MPARSRGPTLATMQKRDKRQYQPRPNRHSRDVVADPGTRSEADLDELLDRLDEPPFLILLDQVTDPQNLGAILRTADGAGVHAVIVPKDRSVGLTATVRSVSCGGADSIPVVMVTNLSRQMDRLRERGIWLIGTADAADESVYDADLTGPLALVFGSEGDGLRRLTAERCDRLVAIPMAGRVASLNVSVSAGVCCYEAVRQRRQETGNF